jgi:hypothetical protein
MCGFEDVKLKAFFKVEANVGVEDGSICFRIIVSSLWWGGIGGTVYALTELVFRLRGMKLATSYNLVRSSQSCMLATLSC